MYGSILYFAFAHYDHLRLCPTLLTLYCPMEHEELTGQHGR